ncbi:MAG: YmfQ family protein [Lachnospiraceae bacterium]|nr:YmfQ family protein [Lachnospiraceae bacterium]
MIRDVDLVSYLPPAVARFLEIKTVLKAEEPEFVLAWNTADKVLKNEFIATADKDGIERFEKMLHILPDADDTLEIRRARVQSKWFIALPYTWRMFMQKIIEICGPDYPAFAALRESYLIYLEAGFGLQWQADSLVDILERMLPCSMGISIRNIVSLDSDTCAPVIKSDWIDYLAEYRGEIYDDAGSMVFKILRIHMWIPFWGGGLYAGTRRYNGTARYNAKRNYGLRLKVKSVLALYMEQAARCAWRFFDSVQNKTSADMTALYFYNNCSMSDGIGGAVCLHAAVITRGAVDVYVETQRNVVRYNGVRRYSGVMKYNALYRKEKIE